MAKQVFKHVFLEYSEYQRYLELKKRNEELVERVTSLEKIIRELKDRDGHGIGQILEKEGHEQLKAPLLSQTESITLPPSARVQTKETLKQEAKPWYFLGRPT